MTDDMLHKALARDAGYGAGYRISSSIDALGDPTRKYIARWMLDGDTESVVAFAAGVYRFFLSRGKRTPLEIAELMSGVVMRHDYSVAYCPSHFPQIQGVSDAQMEQMARQMFDLIASTNLEYA